MASAAELAESSECLRCGLHDTKSLLAAIAYILATANSMSTEPATLAAQSECLRCSFDERGLLAIIAQILDAGGGAGGGLAELGSGSPEGVVTADPGKIYINEDTDAVWYKKTGAGNTGWIQITGPF